MKIFDIIQLSIWLVLFFSTLIFYTCKFVQRHLVRASMKFSYPLKPQDVFECMIAALVPAIVFPTVVVDLLTFWN